MRLVRPSVAVAVLAVALVACGSDRVADDRVADDRVADDGVADDGVGGYIETVATTTEQMTRAAFDALPPGAAPTHSQIAEVVAARRTAVDTISTLTPPSEMRPEHQSLVGAMQSFVIAGEAFIESSASLDPDAFLEALEASTDVDALADVVSLACTAWETRAADLGHAVELGC